MQPGLLRFIVCPGCEGELRLHPFRAPAPGREEVEQGLLLCTSCGLPYPIVDGIPRLVPNAFESHAGFTREFSRELSGLSFRKPARKVVRGFERLHGLTARAFGYEWNTYATTSREEDILTFFFLTGVDPSLYDTFPTRDVFTCYPSPEEVSGIDASGLRGKTVLEVGCGMGKYVKVVSEHARETIGMDLSEALVRARREIGERTKVHLLQGNILAPPLRRESIDFAYSVGVLHHTPDCHQAFLRSASLVKSGGALAVWLYPSDPTPGAYARRVHWIQDDVIRPVTCRLPPAVLRWLSAGLGRLTFVRDRYAERYRATGSRFAYRVAMAAGALAVGRHKDPEIAAFLNFDWYSPQYRSYHTEEQLRGWYREAGFEETRILPQRVSGIAVKATRE